MASIREQLRQLEDVSEGMFDENARFVYASQTFMPSKIFAGFSCVWTICPDQLNRIVDILAKVESENPSETHGTSTPNLSNIEGGGNDLAVGAES